MSDDNVQYNLLQTLKAAGLTGVNRNGVQIKTDALRDLQFGPDIYSEQADAYYEGLGNAVINGGPIQDPLFNFSSNLSQISFGTTNNSSELAIGSVNTGTSISPPGGNWLNSSKIGSLQKPEMKHSSSDSQKTDNNQKTDDKQSSQQDTYSYEIENNGPDGAPTLVYKKNGKTVKTGEVKDTDIYNQGQKKLKEAQETWKKSHSS